MFFLIIILALFFALNMGGSNVAASYAAAYGSRMLSFRRVIVFFLVFVLLGALVLGQQVSTTLGEKLMPQALLTPSTLVVIFGSASLSLFVANMMKIPQATSVVTVAAIAGVGLAHHQLNMHTLMWIVPFWLIFPVLAYVLTWSVTSYVYPPRRNNFWIYERLVNHEERLKWFVVAAGCYNAFSAGANNVANIVGPLSASGAIPMTPALIVIAIVFGVGALLFRGPLMNAGKNIVPLGPLSAAIILLVSGTLMIVASALGIPQSIVMLKMAAIFAVSSLKKGNTVTFRDPETIKTFFNWTINPLITLAISYGLTIVTR